MICQCGAIIGVYEVRCTECRTISYERLMLIEDASERLDEDALNRIIEEG